MMDIGKAWIDGSANPTNSVPITVTAPVGTGGGMFRSSNLKMEVPDSDIFFNSMSKALNEEFEHPGKTPFGLVTPGHIGTPTSRDRLETFARVGEIDNRMSSSFPQIAHDIQVQGDRISDIMKEVPNSSDHVGLSSQLMDCNLKVLEMQDKVVKLDVASGFICSNLKEIGRLTKSVQDISDKEEGTYVEKLLKLIVRITRSWGNKSTPIESYSEMATKKDAKNSTRE